MNPNSPQTDHIINAPSLTTLTEKFKFALRPHVEMQSLNARRVKEVEFQSMHETLLRFN